MLLREVKQDATCTNPTGTCRCAHCGSEYTHFRRVEVYSRDAEDRNAGLRVTVTGHDVRMDSDAGYGNPSRRRDGVRVVLSCESCAGTTSVSLSQEQGQTEVATVPLDERTVSWPSYSAPTGLPVAGPMSVADTTLYCIACGHDQVQIHGTDKPDADIVHVLLKCGKCSALTAAEFEQHADQTVVRFIRHSHAPKQPEHLI